MTVPLWTWLDGAVVLMVVADLTVELFPQVAAPA